MNTNSKIVDRAEAIAQVKALRAAGKVVGYTSGHFDLVHPGHVQYLEDARARCDFLVVGINSDASIRNLKGPGRPVNEEWDRQRVIAGLASVDLVFVFSEPNNNRNIELLIPSVYYKAGDYDLSRLSSKPLIEAQGGRVELIPLLAGRSSTSIFKKIEHVAHPSFAVETAVPSLSQAPAVFVDRDGTINELRDYLSDVSQFSIIPGALEGLKTLQNAGFRIVVTTNQPGIGLGYFTREDMYRIHSRMLQSASALGLLIDKIYFCPHSDAEKCNCRKPATGMIDRAVSELNIDRSRSFVIGDMTADLQFAVNARCTSILVKTGKGGTDKRFDVKPCFECASLAEAAAKIVLGEIRPVLPPPSN